MMYAIARAAPGWEAGNTAREGAPVTLITSHLSRSDRAAISGVKPTKDYYVLCRHKNRCTIISLARWLSGTKAKAKGAFRCADVYRT